MHNRRNNRILSAALPLLLFASLLQAEVYWPIPWKRGGGGKAALFSLNDLDGVRTLMTEPVRWNGVATTLRVGLFERPLDEILAELRARYAGVEIKPATGGSIATFPAVSGWRLRLLFFPNADGRRVTCFEMKLPQKSAPPTWPTELPPLPVGAEPAETICFENTQSWYASFRNSGDRSLTLRYFASMLRSRGFEAMTGEAESIDGGRGELFLRQTPRRETLLISLDEGGGGSMLLRPVRR